MAVTPRGTAADTPPPGPAVPEGEEPAEFPDHRSPARFLWWHVVSQRRRAALAAVLGSVWMVSLALPPYLLSRAVDDGLRSGDDRAVARWAAALLGVGLASAWLSIMRHRTMTRARNDSALRTVRSVVRQSVRLGATLPHRLTAGEVLAIGIGDVAAIADVMTIAGPGVGAVMCTVAVAVVLLSVSPLLGAVVLIGVPALVLALGPLLNRLRGAQSAYRERQGELTMSVADIAGGLRVLAGLGGKEAYGRRHRRGSRALLADGYRVASVASWIDAIAVGLPALFLAAVTWLGARMAVDGAISPGQLVAVYGYVTVLAVPVTSFVESGHQLGLGLVSARRVTDFLALEPEITDTAEHPREPPAVPAELYDPASGTRIEPGVLTALASGRPADSTAVLDRLGRYTASDATWGGVRLDALPLAAVRERILVADNEAHLFSGTLREAVEGREPREPAATGRALRAAAAEDIVQALPSGLGAPLSEQGRSLSGGQRQRLRLARALLADPEVLLAVEPTSAVDAHTEALLAARLPAARAGRTTVVTTLSPLVLARADAVCHLVDGRVAATGTHQELLATSPGYRALVTRDTEGSP
ncbi:ABC transporter transmembrane domain-containing protein [Streptomyces sp. 8L]|uniref:ABC transporter transmembrane domain-containing protein n=1 Tax=Streptomyces sp. 8L TaxID=2877242 RepID=UPI001CD70725|nr:ABC transporter ATP-binding protein [Streptomyces sp. 8L]MCA1222395.1 ABC transporter ATP-binding protein/permease [Streptomyces sp. 8L]